MLGSQECVRITIYSRLDSDDVGNDDFRTKWYLKVDHTSTREESWVQVNLHCQVKSIWISGSLKDEIGYKRIFTYIWMGLCGYHFLSGEDDICTGPCVISNDIPPATSSIGHQECLFQWYSRWEGWSWSNHQDLLFRGSLRRFTDLRSHSTAWNSLREPGLGTLHQWFKGFFLFRAQEDHSVFWQIQNGKRILLVVYVDDIVITWDDTQGLSARSTCRSTFKPRILDP